MIGIEDEETFVAISDRNINFRAPEETHLKIRELKAKFERDRSWIIRKAIDIFWTVIFYPANLREFFDEWEAFLRKNGPNGATHRTTQLQLVFGEPLPAMYPRFSGMRTPERPQPEHGPSRPKELVEMAALGASNLGRLRLIFAHRSTAKVA